MDARCVRLWMAGVSRYVVNLVEHLTARSDVDVQIVALTSDEVHPRLAAAPGVTCIQVGRAPRFRWNEERLRFEQTVLPRLLSRLGADLYHATWNYGVPLVSRVPAVVTVHDLMSLTHPAETDPGSRIRRWAYRVSMGIAAARARRIIAVSRTTADEVARFLHVPPHRIRVTHEAPDDEFHRPIDEATRRRVRTDLGLTEPYLIYMGGADRRKNVGTLLRAVEYARGRLGVPVVLALTIRPERLSERDAATARIIGPDGVRFLGHVPDGDLPAVLAGARAFVFASRAEGFGLPPLEAMACGAPVISATSGSLAEIVADAGLLLDAEDVPAWAEAMARAWTDEAWRRDLAARGRTRAASFTWARTADATLAVYRDALGIG